MPGSSLILIEREGLESINTPLLDILVNNTSLRLLPLHEIYLVVPCYHPSVVYSQSGIRATQHKIVAVALIDSKGIQAHRSRGSHSAVALAKVDENRTLASNAVRTIMVLSHIIHTHRSILLGFFLLLVQIS